MALEHIVAAANDGDLQQRIAARVVGESGFDNTTEDPVTWAITNRWALAASPNWGDAYNSAVLSFIDRPGLRPGAITDQMILPAVQARLTELATP